MKFIKKVFLCLIIIAIVITSFAPYQTKAENLTGEHEEIVNAGNTKSNDDNSVIISKNILLNNEENYFDIELTVKTKKKVSEITIPQDLAIVLVLDTSGSMKNNFGNGKTRLQALKDALTKNGGFIDQFVSSSKEALKSDPNTKRTLSVITYNNQAILVHDWRDYKINESDAFAADFKNVIDKLGTDTGTAPSVGLKLAGEKLAGVKSNNKYIIFLTDGYPTAQCEKGYKSSTKCRYYSSYGSYNDLAATQATDEALINKEAGIKTYSIGVGVDGEREYTNHSEGQPTKTYNNESYVVGYTKTVSGSRTTYFTGHQHFKEWLGGNAKYNGRNSNYGIAANVTRGNPYYDVTDSAGLQEAYNAIFSGIKEDIEKLAQAWTVKDPMNFKSNETPTDQSISVGDYVEFVNFYETSKEGLGNKLTTNEIHNEIGGKVDNEVSFNTSTNSINWNLRKSDPVKEEDLGNNVTLYTYRLTYRVRLKNETKNKTFNESTKFSTNGNASLDYVLVENSIITKQGTLNFPNPVVIARSNNIEFNKKSSYNDILLNGAKFKIELNSDGENTKRMFAELKHIDEKYNLTSESKDGKVEFKNVPSGYDYKLIETDAPEGYSKDENQVYYFSIIDGEIKNNTIPENIYNTPNYYNLIVKKEVKANNEENQQYVDSNKEFTFNIVTNDLKADHYDAVINENETSITINEGKGTFTLKHNEEITISIPYGTEYEIIEEDATGYVATYDNNKKGIIEVTGKETKVINNRIPKNLSVKKYWNKVSDYTKMPIIEVVLQRRIGNNNWEDFKTVQIKSTIENGQVKGGSYNWKELDGDYSYRVRETKVIDSETGEELNYFTVKTEHNDDESNWTITNTDNRIPEIPETGSSGMLILTIIALMCFAMPIINKVNNFYRYIKVEYM